MNLYKHIYRSALCILPMSCLLMSGNIYAGQSIKKSNTHVAEHELQWQTTPFGPEAAVISGDFTAGKHITYIKFEPGMKTPIHVHSNDYTGVVISGITKHWIVNQKDTHKELAAGSNWSIPADTAHVSECLSQTQCIMVIYQDAAFDFIPVNSE